MIGLIALSLGITSLVAFLIALGFSFIKPDLGYAIFWIVFGFEWVIMEPVNRMLKIKAIREEGNTFEKLAKYEATVGKQSIALECEYCNEMNAVKMKLDQENTFICSKCGNGNKVRMQFTTVRVTNPLDLEGQSPSGLVDADVPIGE